MAGAIVGPGGLNCDFVLQADRLPRPGVQEAMPRRAEVERLMRGR